MQDEFPTPVAYMPEDRAHDPREQQEWFLRLPEDAKRDLRARWAAAEGHTAALGERRNRTLRRYLLESVGCLLLVFGVFHLFSLYGCVLAGLVGLAVGGAAYACRAGTYRFAWLGALGYVLFGFLHGRLNIAGFIICTAVFAMLGTAHVLNRYDMTE